MTLEAKQDALRSLGEGGLLPCTMSRAFGRRRIANAGLTSDLKKRLAEHNAGKSAHTSKFKPWRLVTYLAFSDRTRAEAFERYLKAGPGCRQKRSLGSTVDTCGNAIRIASTRSRTQKNGNDPMKISLTSTL